MLSRPQAAKRRICVQDVRNAEVDDVDVRIFQHFIQIGIHKSLALTELLRALRTARADGDHLISRGLDGVIIDVAQPVGSHDGITQHSSLLPEHIIIWIL